MTDQRPEFFLIQRNSGSVSITQLPITMHVACTWTTPKGSLSSLAKPPTMRGDSSSEYPAGRARFPVLRLRVGPASCRPQI